VPGYAEVRSIGTTKQEFQIDLRTFHEPVFPTASGKCIVHAVEAPLPMEIGPNQVRIATLRSEGQFNTVVYEEHDFYRGQDRRDVILLNVDDMRAMGLQSDQQVTVRTETGSMCVLARPFDIARGNAAMYYPEANTIVPRTTDPASRTPAFKGVVASIEIEADC